jgi:diguanylate cyclase (GGDEF)-like protein
MTNDPTSQAPSNPPAADTASVGEPARRPRLLVVDDQPINIQVLYQAFSSDHQIFMATSGEQALTLCAAKQPDLVLLDVVMPGMDGHEVCRRLKANPATRDIPVIFVTAHNDEAAETLGLEIGAADFITKPINPKIVRARVRTQLTLKTQTDSLRKWVYADGLTGAFSRSHFEERLAIEWARAVRNDTALSVVLLDLDFFKRYNERYGHEAGDECLRRVANCFKATLKRPADLLARFGGDEFACLLPETDLTGALAVAGELSAAAHALQIACAEAPDAAMVTISLGVGCKPMRGHRPLVGADAGAALGGFELLIGAAAAQLQLAKSGGRDRACGDELAAWKDATAVSPPMP